MHLLSRVPVISPTSRGPIINLVGWITMVIMCLAVLTVLCTKYLMLGKFGWNDVLITLAMILSIAHTLVVSKQVGSGLGRPVKELLSSQVTAYEKAAYASNVIYVLALAAGKFSTLHLLFMITPDSSHRRIVCGVSIFLGAWTVAATFASMFQCSVPSVWAINTGNCINQPRFWKVIGALDITIDILIMAIPVMIIKDLQMGMKRKIAVLFAFSFRFLSITATILRLDSLSTAYPPSDNFTLTATRLAVTTQLEVVFSIFATCVPHLRPFMEALQGEYLSGQIQGTSHQRTVDGSYELRDIKSTGNRNGQNFSGTNLVPFKGVTNVNIMGSTERPRSGISNGGSEEMIIQRTTDWSVSYGR